MACRMRPTVQEVAMFLSKLSHLMSKRNYILLGTSVLAVALVTGAAVQWHGSQQQVTLPQETPIHVTLDQTLSSDHNQTGDQFQATVAEPVVVAGKTAIPEGAAVTGRVVDAHESGRLHGRARLYLTLETMQVNGKSYDVQTANSGRVGGAHKKRNIALIAGGGGGGALIGALAGGGKGALIGGPIGAGAGTAAAYFTGKKDIHLPAETHLTFRLAEPVTVAAKS
jgi:hypothetical protein